MYVRTFTVGETPRRVRLDRFLEAQLPDVSRGLIRRAINRGEVTIDGEVRETGRLLLAGQTVEIRMAEEPVAAMAPEDLPISVVHEDDAIIVVDKAAGMYVHPTHRVHGGTVLNAVAFHLAVDGRQVVRPLLVHRLDRATSGLLVISKTPRAHNVLARAWHDRKVKKIYLALVCGRLAPSGETGLSPSGIIDAPIGGARDRHPGFAVDPAGRSARTRFSLVDELGPQALYELEPLTGRTNQLRIHCAHAGGAIAGDDLHGQPELEVFHAAHPEVPKPSRLLLHAWRLEFDHPVTGDPVALEALIPSELATYLKSARR